MQINLIASAWRRDDSIAGGFGGAFPIEWRC